MTAVKSSAKLGYPVVIITGASAGIGAAAARQLSPTARLVLIGRSAATKTIADELGDDYFRADFSQLANVRDLALKLLAAYPRIDLLINNAGGIMPAITDTIDGFESTFQVNYLAQFLLTNLLMERLITSRAGIINTSSMANLSAKLSLDDLQRATSPFRAYANSKLLDIMHAKELSRRYQSGGVVAVSFHPGVIATDFARQTTGLFALLYNTPLRRLLKSPADGADTLVWLVQNRASWQPGGYYVKRKLASFNKLAADDASVSDVWDQTQRLVSTDQG